MTDPLSLYNQPSYAVLPYKQQLCLCLIFDVILEHEHRAYASMHGSLPHKLRVEAEAGVAAFVVDTTDGMLHCIMQYSPIHH